MLTDSGARCRSTVPAAQLRARGCCLHSGVHTMPVGTNDFLLRCELQRQILPGKTTHFVLVATLMVNTVV